jgi:hypothetical protein
MQEPREEDFSTSETGEWLTCAHAHVNPIPRLSAGNVPAPDDVPVRRISRVRQDFRLPRHRHGSEGHDPVGSTHPDRTGLSGQAAPIIRGEG